MKTIIAAGILLSAAAPAVAGPYANVENNASFRDQEFGTGITEVHAGYKFDNGIYVQGGPAFVAARGEGTKTEYSGKAGFTTALADDLDLYGEVSFVTNNKEFSFDDMNLGTKVGFTYSF